MSGEGAESGGPGRDEIEGSGSASNNEPKSFSPDKTLIPKHPGKEIEGGRDRYQPNAHVRRFLAEADAEAIRKGFVPQSDEVTKAEFENLELYLSDPTSEIIPPEEMLFSVETLPVSYEALSATLLTLAPIPPHIQDRIRKDPESDLTTEELTEIYKGVRKKLEKDPKAARLEDLSLIIDSEISGILKEHEESGIDIDASGMYTDPTVVKLTSLSKCEAAIDKMLAGKAVDPTSAEAEALDDYLRKKIKTFTKLKNDKKNPEAIALAKACIAYFGSLHDQTFEDAKYKKTKKKKNKKD